MLTRWCKALLALSLCMILFSVPLAASGGQAVKKSFEYYENQIEYPSTETTRGTPYPKWKKQADGLLPASAHLSDIRVSGNNYEAFSDDAVISESNTEGLQWANDIGWVEWKVVVPVSGLYILVIVYDSMDDSPADIVRGVQINGTYPYVESERIQLKRQFMHDSYPFVRDSFGNDRRPQSVEVKGWKEEFLSDMDSDSRPLLWPMLQGENKIRLVGQSSSIKVKEIRLAAPQEISSQDNSELSDPAKGQGTWLHTYEAEQISRKSNASIQLQSSDYPRISPEPGGYIRYNSIGGEQFKQSGQWVEWEIEVPSDGIYQIGFKYLQAYLNNFNAYRMIEIDKQVMYEEMGKVKFPYGKKWRNMTLSDDIGKPLAFELSKGKHTVRMTVTAAPIKPIYEGIVHASQVLADIETDIRLVTGNTQRTYASGGNVDMNRDWELEKYMPDLKNRLQKSIDELLLLADALQSVSSVGISDVENSLRIAADDLLDMKNNVRKIPNELNRFAKMRSNLGVWLYRLIDQPLLLDSLYVAELGAELPRAGANGFESMGYAIKSFFRSFTIDYDFRRQVPGAIDVWVNRGRDYADLIQQLADETFTPDTGITVNINLVPDPNMFVLGNAAGIQPDVALGVDMAMPVDFAMRGALLDLSSFSEYEEVAQRFHPGALSVYHFDRGEYALPETQGFNVLAYRTDILDRLSLKPPETWEELYKMLSTLQHAGYDFYLNPKDFNTFLFQNDAELYTEDGMLSGLDSEKAFRGFNQLTDMFNLYQLPLEVPSFFNHFRQGDLPIGVIDFNTYLQIQFAAPEIAGNWAIAPMPGVRNAQGEVERWSGGAMQGGVIFKKTEKPEESWSFLKWWTSEEIQTRFGNEIEAMFGPEYRWNTANVQSFPKLPWPSQDLAVINEQRTWFKEAPQVPGGYFTGRMLDFAWNNTIIKKQNPREALERAVVDINREMRRKQVEFGLISDQGEIIRSLDVPRITEPSDREAGR